MVNVWFLRVKASELLRSPNRKPVSEKPVSIWSYTSQPWATVGGYQLKICRSARIERMRKMREVMPATMRRVPATETWVVLAEGVSPCPQWGQ